MTFVSATQRTKKNLYNRKCKTTGQQQLQQRKKLDVHSKNIKHKVSFICCWFSMMKKKTTTTTPNELYTAG